MTSLFHDHRWGREQSWSMKSSIHLLILSTASCRHESSKTPPLLFLRISLALVAFIWKWFNRQGSNVGLQPQSDLYFYSIHLLQLRNMISGFSLWGGVDSGVRSRGSQTTHHLFFDYPDAYAPHIPAAPCPQQNGFVVQSQDWLWKTNTSHVPLHQYLKMKPKWKPRFKVQNLRHVQKHRNE